MQKTKALEGAPGPASAPRKLTYQHQARESRLCLLTPAHKEEGSQGQGDHPQANSHADPGLTWPE